MTEAPAAKRARCCCNCHADATVDATGAAAAARAATDPLYNGQDVPADLRFAFATGLAKTVPRTGWVRHGVPNVESVADHSFRMALLAFGTLRNSESEVDRDRCIKMALIHDLAEGLVGDITPDSGIAKEEKHQREEAAMGQLAKHLEPMNPEAGKELLALWLEYNQGLTAEARTVKDFDRIDMSLQALEYETRALKAGALAEFFDGVRGKMKTALGQRWWADIENIRRSLGTSDSSSSDKDRP